MCLITVTVVQVHFCISIPTAKLLLEDEGELPSLDADDILSQFCISQNILAEAAHYMQIYTPADVMPA
mgnify:CR=1 FL=1